MPVTPEFGYHCDLRSMDTTFSYSISDDILDAVVLGCVYQTVAILQCVDDRLFELLLVLCSCAACGKESLHGSKINEARQGCF